MQTMKKLLALTAAGLLLAGAAGAGQPNAAGQKWLQVFQRKLAAGQTQIFTPAPERIALLKQWAINNGYSTKVTQTGATYRIALAKSLAQQ